MFICAGLGRKCCKVNFLEFFTFILFNSMHAKFNFIKLLHNRRYTYMSTRGMLLLTKAKRPLKFKMLCGFNKHAVKLRMHKAAPYDFPIPLNTF